MFFVFTSNMTSNTRVPSKADKIRWEWSLLAKEHRMALTLDRQLTGARGLASYMIVSPLMSFIYFFCIFASLRLDVCFSRIFLGIDSTTILS